MNATDSRHAYPDAADVLKSIADAIVTTDVATRITYLNPVAERLTGWTATEAIGQRACDVMPLLTEESKSPITCMAERCLAEGRAIDLQAGAILRRRDGREVPIGDSAAPIRNSDGAVVGVVLVVHDESEQRRVGRRLYFDATHDPLTGLVNRREFEMQFVNLANSSAVPATRHVLLCLDLDRLKPVNDVYGHEAGDAVLRGIGPLISRRLRANDTLARLGGDEFGVLLKNCTLHDACKLADAIRADVKNWRCSWMASTLSIGVSIGVCAFSSEDDDMAAVMRAADAACYRAKARAGGVVVHARTVSMSRAVAVMCSRK